MQGTQASQDTSAGMVVTLSNADSTGGRQNIPHPGFREEAARDLLLKAAELAREKAALRGGDQPDFEAARPWLMAADILRELQRWLRGEGEDAGLQRAQGLNACRQVSVSRSAWGRLSRPGGAAWDGQGKRMNMPAREFLTNLISCQLPWTEHGLKAMLQGENLARCSELLAEAVEQLERQIKRELRSEQSNHSWQQASSDAADGGWEKDQGHRQLLELAAATTDCIANRIAKLSDEERQQPEVSRVFKLAVLFHHWLQGQGQDARLQRRDGMEIGPLLQLSNNEGGLISRPGGPQWNDQLDTSSRRLCGFNELLKSLQGMKVQWAKDGLKPLLDDQFVRIYYARTLQECFEASRRLRRGERNEKPRAERARPFRNEAPEDVEKTFLALVEQTCPAKKEAERFGPMLQEMGFEIDALGNGRLEIPLPDGSPSTTGFCAHMDDVSSKRASPMAQVVKLQGQRLAYSSGKTILGADDKAGMSVLLHLIQARVPGRYMLFVQEESGMIGSRHAARAGWGQGLSRLIAFDRRGTSEVITHQRSERCASQGFAEALCDALAEGGLGGLVPSSKGSFTDSAAFTRVIPECTNIAAGYKDAHGHRESQDLGYLTRLAQACTRVDWEALPTLRKTDERGEHSGISCPNWHPDPRSALAPLEVPHLASGRLSCSDGTLRLPQLASQPRENTVEFARRCASAYAAVIDDLGYHGAVGATLDERPLRVIGEWRHLGGWTFNFRIERGRRSLDGLIQITPDLQAVIEQRQRKAAEQATESEAGKADEQARKTEPAAATVQRTQLAEGAA